MRSLVSILVVLFVGLSIASAQRIAGCGFGNWDFSPIGNSDLYYNGGGWTYVLRMCGSVSDDLCAQDTTTIGSMLCQRTNNTANDFFSLMTYTSTAGVWGSEGTGVYYQLATGERCNANNANLRSTTLHFVCDATASTPVITSVTEPSTCQYHVYIRTNIPCNGLNGACSFLGIDFSQMFDSGRQDLNYTNNFNWYLNMCNRVNNPNCQADSTANNTLLCQRRLDGSESFAISQYNTSALTWSIITSGSNAGLLAVSQNGEYCGAISNNRQFRVYFVCDRTLTPTGSYISGVSETSTCVYQMTVFTSLTCPLVPSTGSNDGSLSSSSWYPNLGDNCVFNVGGRNIDFSSLKNGNDLVYRGFVGGTYYNVSFHMCGVVRNAQCLNDSTTYNAQICQASVTNPRDNWAMSTFIRDGERGMIWGLTSTGVQFYQSTGEFCGAIRRSITVRFVCNPDATRAYIDTMSEPTTCRYTMVVQTNIVCNGTNTPQVPVVDEPFYRNCVYQVGLQKYDFKTLNPADGSDLTVTAQLGSTPYNFFMRICDKVSNTGCRSDTTSQNAMICQQQISSNPNSYSFADNVQENMIWGQVPGQQVIRLKMINGEICGSAQREVTIDFVCNPAYPNPQIISVQEVKTCEYYMVVAANSLMCSFSADNPDQAGGGSSFDGGKIALLVLVLILGLLLIIFACAVWRQQSRPYAFQKEDQAKAGVEMHGEPHNTYEVEESQSQVTV